MAVGGGFERRLRHVGRARRQIAAPRAHVDARTLHADADRMKLSVQLAGRVVAEQVVRAQSSVIRLNPRSMSFEPTIARPSVASASLRSDVFRAISRALSCGGRNRGVGVRPSRRRRQEQSARRIPRVRGDRSDRTKRSRDWPRRRWSESAARRRAGRARSGRFRRRALRAGERIRAACPWSSACR